MILAAEATLLPQDKNYWITGELVIDCIGICIAEHDSHQLSPKWKPQHLYITIPKAELKTGDWVLFKGYDEPGLFLEADVFQWDSDKRCILPVSKIIASTDTNIINPNYDVYSISLPFLKEWVRLQGECTLQVDWIADLCPYCICGKSDYYHCDAGGDRCGELKHSGYHLDNKDNLVINLEPIIKKLYNTKDIYMNQTNDKQSGFFDLPKETQCTHPGHNPPSHLHIPPGKGYKHVCPECGKTTTIIPTQISF